MLEMRGVARQLEELVSGEYDLSELSREDKVVFLRSLWLAYDATHAVGWDEHTSDWDWTIEAQTSDKREVANETRKSEEGADEYVGCDVFGLAYDAKESMLVERSNTSDRANMRDYRASFTACVDWEKVEYVWFERSVVDQSHEQHVWIEYAKVDELVRIVLYSE